MFPALTDEQRAAVDHDGNHLLIVAGAGSGKTTTLASRLAALVARGVAPERILLLTFSRRAAAELIRRAEALAGHDVSRRVWGGTFHAVANRVLRRHGSLLGLAADFTVFDQADAADLLALVRAELQARDGLAVTERRRAKKDTMAAILSRVVNTATPLSKVLHETYPWCAQEQSELKAAFEAYTARKRATSVLDYDDLLLCWSALVRSPAAAPRLERFDHVLIDEYQDTNAIQAEIVAALADGGATVTAVGDDAQAIYGFRNATPRNILEFPDRFGSDVVVLDRNHRSTPSILATTNAVIAEAARRHEKVLWSTRDDGPRPALVTCADEGAQSAAVCERVLEQFERGVPLRHQAVLFRAAHHSDLLELELGARRIPYVKYGGLRFTEAAHVKDFLAAARIVANPADELAWFRLIRLHEGIGPVLARRV
ncbi:MAG TPA: ATP-dependent helicase, partial [Acidimicrobiales bacterium]|nr:ATP-dependent helicase [Acidimicrobiales bacterium]